MYGYYTPKTIGIQGFLCIFAIFVNYDYIYVNIFM